MIEINLKKRILFLSFALVLLFNNNIFSQKVINLDTIENTVYLGKFKLKTPSFFKSKYTYDPISNKYIYTTKVGEIDVGIPLVLTPEQYRKRVREENIINYFSEKTSLLKDEDAEESTKLKNLLPNLYVNSNFFQTIFGGDNIELTPQGSISLDIGARYQKSDNPSVPSRNQSNIGLDFNQNINLSMNGKIGERLSISSNYDTQSTFDFQNLLKLDYTPTEDDIIQKIELGNVSMPLSGSLISGAQSLFGFKTQLKFGNTNITAVLSEQKSESQTVVSKGSGSFEEFSISPLDYDENRHFFLGQYFRDQYEKTVKTFPYLNTQIKISRIEVWVTNRSSQTQNVRNIIALQDLGESNSLKTRLDDLFPSFFLSPGVNTYPDNSVNKLDPDEIGNGLLNLSIREISKSKEGFGPISSLVNEGIDFSVLENARKLESSEYNLQDKLGYISLNQPLNNDEILAVAFQYTVGGEVFQVGEFANDGIDASSLSNQSGQQQISNNSLILKLLKSSVTNVDQPVWDLMMKNIYSLGSQINKNDFKLNVYYSNPSPLNYIQAVDDSTWPNDIDGRTLLSLFNIDKLNMNNDIQEGGDGFFDFVPNITIDSRRGLIIFPSIEPFGEYLFEKLKSVSGSVENYSSLSSYNLNQLKFVYSELYSSSKIEAEKVSEKNKFQIKGSYKTTGEVGGIAIGQFNVPRGSVKVTAGGRVLQEGLDYTVNYQAGRVQILDESLKNSNVPIEISTESNSFYSQQKKRFSGINVEHKFNENFIIGGTLMNLSERSVSQKANYGVEPVNNTMIGFNGTFSSPVPFLTRLVNKLPNINSDVESNISFKTEFAYLHAGAPKSSGFDNVATVYVDDFEGTETNIDLKDTSSWNLSSTPIGVNGGLIGLDDLRSGYNRAKLSWYNIDPIFYTRQRPNEIDENELSKNETRRIFIDEIFPQQDIIEGQSRVQNTFDLSFYPSEKGPYNNSLVQDFSNNTSSNWAGITRDLSSTNFEKSNVEFVQFWLLDTFSDNESSSNNLGNLVLNLGNISEDILKDGKKLYENGLPIGNTQEIVNESNWGKTPATQSLVYSFDSDPNNRVLQDLGYDGLNDNDEAQKYNNGNTNDPAGDNYQYYIDAIGGIQNRYKNYNGTQGNSPVNVGNSGRGSTTIPDNEDVNQDNTMNTIDSYFEYTVPIKKNMNAANHPFISDVRNDVEVDLPNGTSITTRWIQFKVPVSSKFYNNIKYNQYFEPVGGLDNLRSIRFMRMYLEGFTSPVNFRFGTLDLVRSEWKRFTKSLNNENINHPNTSTEIGSVNILENENRTPINYVLPPGVEREQISSNSSIIRQNEQSLSLKVSDLQPKDSKGVYKIIDFDMRQYKSLKMFIHAESIEGSETLPGEGVNDEMNKRLVGFLRIGSDLTDNYYQIEIPLKPTSYNNGSSNRFSADQVWNPDENSIDFSLETLTQIKAKAMSLSGLSDAIYFDEELNVINEFSNISDLPGDKKFKYAIKGNPTIGSIKNIMIGVKNPSQTSGDILSGEVWFNELRLSEIDGKGGWSALASLDANFADFANISLSGKMSTIGFGSIDKSPNQRSREEIKQYGLLSSINVGQLLPKKWEIQIPVSYSISEEFSTPEYDPFFQDIKLEDRLNSADTQQDKQSIKNQAISYRKISSINLLGVKKNRSEEQKERVYDIENFDFSYSYNQELQHDYEIENLTKKTARVSSAYNYTFNPFVISPFKKIKFLENNKYLEWLKEFNFNPLLSSLSFDANINRAFNSQQFRDVFVEGADMSDQIALPEIQQRHFLFDWNLSLSQNLSNSLRIDFSASNNSIVKNYFKTDVLGNKTVDKEFDIWDGFWNTGEANSHNQSFQLTYELPFKLFPLINFISSSYNYSGDFNWERGTEAMASVVDPNTGIPMGNVNTVQNSNSQAFNVSFNMSKLYRNLKLQKNKKPKNSSEKFKNSVIGFFTGLSRFKFSYTENSGKVLPGFLETIGFLGTSKPSLGFVFGSQSDIRFEAAKNGWLTNFPSFNEQFTQVHNTKFDISAEISWIDDLKISLKANRKYSENFSENFKVEDNTYNSLSPNSFGNFEISTMLIKTSFSSSNENVSKTFDDFQNNRLVVAQRLAVLNGDVSGIVDEFGFPIGYGKNNQAVLIPAFLSAYSGKNAETISLNAVSKTPLPSWSISYSGFMNFDFIKDRFKRFSLGHAYRSSYTLNNFKSNLEYDPNNTNLTDDSGNYINEILYTNVNLVEQFNPLLKIDMELNNSLQIVMSLKKDRALSLSLDNNLLTESSGTDYSIGLGYRIKDLKFTNRVGGKRRVSKGDLNIKTDLNFRDNITVIRNLNILDNKVTAGQTMWSLKTSADYNLSESFNAIFFYDHMFSKFAISTAFPMTTIRAGMTLRYSFGE